MTARDFLAEHVRREFGEAFGATESKDLNNLINAWMDDEHNSAWRYKALLQHAPSAYKVLDVAAGCGDAVFYGLMNGFDAWGIEPSSWKQEFLRKKAEEKGYPASWLDRIPAGVAEELPFADNEFDAVLSHQTLQHVTDPQRVIHEMIRVTCSGGVIHITCPDSRSTFEPHYRLPWLPLMPRGLARPWLRLNRRPTSGLARLQHITPAKVKDWLSGSPKPVTFHHLDERPRWRKAASSVRSVFRREMQVNLLLVVV